MTERKWSPQEFQQVRDMHAAFQVLNQPMATLVHAHKAIGDAEKFIRPFANRFMHLNTGEASIYTTIFMHAVHLLAAERTEDPVRIAVATQREREQQQLMEDLREGITSEIPAVEVPALNTYLATVDAIARFAAGAFLTGVLPPSQGLITGWADRLQQAKAALPQELFTALRTADKWAEKGLQQEERQKKKQGKGEGHERRGHDGGRDSRRNRKK